MFASSQIARSWLHLQKVNSTYESIHNTHNLQKTPSNARSALFIGKRVVITFERFFKKMVSDQQQVQRYRRLHGAFVSAIWVALVAQTPYHIVDICMVSRRSICAWRSGPSRYQIVSSTSLYYRPCKPKLFSRKGYQNSPRTWE